MDYIETEESVTVFFESFDSTLDGVNPIDEIADIDFNAWLLHSGYYNLHFQSPQ